MVEAVDLHCKQPIWLAPHHSSLLLPLLQPLWQPYLQHNGHYLEVSGMSKPVLPAISLCYPSHPLTFAYCLYIHCVCMYVCVYVHHTISYSLKMVFSYPTSFVCLSICSPPPPLHLSVCAYICSCAQLRPPCTALLHLLRHAVALVWLSCSLLNCHKERNDLLRGSQGTCPRHCVLTICE